ncbi:MAG TPA: hypothetical protein VGL07_16995 [Buttiauxella sp.]|jgi:hypothetical protein
MLDKDYQVRAFQALQATGGLIKPAALKTASSCIDLATSRQVQLAAMISSDVVYPPSISPEVTYIKSSPAALKNICEHAAALASLIEANATKSELIGIQIGWDVYCKVNHLPSDTQPQILVAITDDRKSGNLQSQLQLINTAPAAACFARVNAALKLVPPVLSDALIQEVRSVTTALQQQITACDTPAHDVEQLASNAANSVNAAHAAKDDAITIILLDSLTQGGSMNDAALTLLPDSVKSELLNRPS